MRPLREYIDELRSLDQNNIGSWPTWAYGLAIAVVSLVIMIIAAWYFVLPTRAALGSAERRESQLKQTFEIKHREVANLAAYTKQLATMRAEFGRLLQQLPSQSEVPSLLSDISQVRSQDGLDEELFKPAPEIDKGFYAILPNDLIVTGNFHDFARFVSDVAALPRIVTISNVHIAPLDGHHNGHGPGTHKGPLRMTLTASTYQYLGSDHKKAGQAGKGGGS